MIESLRQLFSTFSLMPHGNCFPWHSGLFWLHVISDTVIALAYYSIFIALLVIIRQRTSLAYTWIFHLLGMSILLCGTTYLLGTWAIWQSEYWLFGIVKTLTAIVLLITGILIWPLLPKILALPSPEQLLKVNQELGDALARHKRTENELRKLSMAVEHSSSMVVITDRMGRIEYCNPAFCKVTGYTKMETLERQPSILKSGLTDGTDYRAMWNTLSHGNAWEGELLKRKKNGDLYWCLEFVTPISDEQGRATHYMAVSHDITDLKNSEETIRRLAFYDPLTELPNRTLFKERLEQTLLYAKRNETLFALVYLDVDRFKNINDSLGHAFGDQLLIAVGQRLRQCLREEDTVARLSGDEFGIIIPGLRHPKLAGAVATTIGQAMNQPFEVADHTLFATASLGISLYPTNHSEVDQLIKMADTAMYQAKELGRNQYQFYHEIPHAVTVEQLSLETCLRYALERDELEIHYQPKLELASGCCFTVEALIRWRHPVHGMILPARFIPIAEETGLIGPIGEWLLRKVCRQIESWHAAGIDLSVAVNLSARQFRQKNLLDRIDAILEETGVDRSRLEFEITESTVMNNPKQTAEILRRMKSWGVAISIDDFGTGYSSLSYLKLFPIDILKIDRSFVRDIDSDTGDTRIVRAIVALGHSLDLTVVAEGVETREQIEFLKRHHCNLVQGYFFSPPLPPDELTQVLRCKKAMGNNWYPPHPFGAFQSEFCT